MCTGYEEPVGETKGEDDSCVGSAQTHAHAQTHAYTHAETYTHSLLTCRDDPKFLFFIHSPRPRGWDETVIDTFPEHHFYFCPIITSGIVSTSHRASGSNYAMAKQLQKWRAIVARADGHRSSATVGPATLTESVMHNRSRSFPSPSL